jgi:hypothetical protein
MSSKPAIDAGSTAHWCGYGPRGASSSLEKSGSTRREGQQMSLSVHVMIKYEVVVIIIYALLVMRVA